MLQGESEGGRMGGGGGCRGTFKRIKVTSEIMFLLSSLTLKKISGSSTSKGEKGTGGAGV